MTETNYKNNLLNAAQIFKSKLTFKSCLVFLFCAYSVFVTTGIPIIGYRLLGISIFTGASIVVFYKFNWVKYFFYAWAFITLLSVTSIEHFFECSTHIHAIAIVWMATVVTNALTAYATGRLINRIEPKKLKENWVDVLAIAAFISIIGFMLPQNAANYLNETYHFVPTVEALFDNAEKFETEKFKKLGEVSTYFDLGLFLWPIWLLEFVVTVCLVFLFTLPFYRLWRFKHAIIATGLIPVIRYVPILICFAYDSANQSESLDEYAIVSTLWLGQCIVPLGVFVGGLCTVFLKRILNKQRQSKIVNDQES